MQKVTRTFVFKVIKFILFWLVFGYLFFLVGRHIKLFIPIIGGLTLFGMMNPVVKLAEQKLHLSHNVAVISSFVVVVLGLACILTWFSILAFKEIHELSVKWPVYVNFMRHRIDAVWPKVHTLYNGLDPKVSDTIGQSVNMMGGKTAEIVSQAVVIVSAWALSLPQVFIMLVITLVAAFFITKNWAIYKRDLLKVFPEEWQISLKSIGSDFLKALAGFIRAELILVLGTIVLSILGLFVIGVPYFLLAGFISGIFAILPVLGAGLLLVPWAVLELLAGNYPMGIELLVLVSILSVLRHIIEPKILGDNVGLDPLFVLLSMYIGLELMGPAGLLLGPFIVIFYKSLQKAGVFRNL